MATEQEQIPPTKEMESISIGEMKINPNPNPTNNNASSNSISNSNIHVESFSISTDSNSNLFGMESMNMSINNVVSNRGIIGTVTFFNKSAMVWIGWGDLEERESECETEKCEGTGAVAGAVAGTGIPTMGPMVVAMPRSKYAGLGGGSSEDVQVPCSQLISGPDDEEMMLGFQMASRLAKKVGWPVFVSSSLDTNTNNSSDASMNMDRVEGMEGGFGFGDSSSVSYAAALAEKKVGEIILKRKAELE